MRSWRWNKTDELVAVDSLGLSFSDVRSTEPGMASNTVNRRDRPTGKAE